MRCPRGWLRRPPGRGRRGEERGAGDAEDDAEDVRVAGEGAQGQALLTVPEPGEPLDAGSLSEKAWESALEGWLEEGSLIPMRLAERMGTAAPTQPHSAGTTS